MSDSEVLRVREATVISGLSLAAVLYGVTEMPTSFEQGIMPLCQDIGL